jgi:ABC-type branched-subunit amino acid transport system substrate-binding protein
VAALACGLLVSCAGGLSAPGPDRRAYDAALEALARDPEAGEAALERFIEDHPRSAWADDRQVAAMRHLEWLLQHHPRGDQSDLARLRLAEILTIRGYPDRAYRTALRIRLSLLEREDRRRAHRLLAQLAGESDDRVHQLRWLSRVRADQSDPAAAAEVDAEMDALVAGLTDAELSSAAQQLGKRHPAARIYLERARRLLEAGDRTGAAQALERARRLPAGDGDGERMAQLERQLGNLPAGGFLGVGPPQPLEPAPFGGAGASGRLGVVLPLSGPYAEFAEETLEGILLAAGLFDAGASGPGASIELVLRDSRGDPGLARAAVRELAQDPDTVAVFGPLLGDESEAAAEEAEALGLPLFPFTRREEVAQERPHVLRFGATPRLEVELLADYAIRELGLARFAILYPDDEYGRTLRAVFWDAVAARGGEVVGVGRYAPDATDFAAPIRRLIGYELLSGGAQQALAQRKRLEKRAKRLPPEAAAELRAEAAALRAPDGSALPPFVDFDALFIPDAHENAGLIAPHLAFHRVRGVRLLGPSGWNDPALLELGGQHVDGAVFTGGYFGGSRLPQVAEFDSRFRATFDRTPSFLAAQAFDATNLVVLQLVRGNDEREPLLDGLRSTRQLAGVSGGLAVRDGEVVRRPHLLGVERGELISVDERGDPPHLRKRMPASLGDQQGELP